jgi:hypothetical protein
VSAVSCKTLYNDAEISSKNRRHCHKNFNFAAQAISPKSQENKLRDPFMATGVYVTGKTLCKAQYEKYQLLE